MGLPFATWSGGLPGPIGDGEKEIQLEEGLVSLSNRGVAPGIVSAIVEFDHERAEHRRTNEQMRVRLTSARAQVPELDLGEDDRNTLIANINYRLKE